MICSLLTSLCVLTCGLTDRPLERETRGLVQGIRGKHRPQALLLQEWRLQKLSTALPRALCAHDLVYQESMPASRRSKFLLLLVSLSRQGPALWAQTSLHLFTPTSWHQDLQATWRRRVGAGSTRNISAACPHCCPPPHPPASGVANSARGMCGC